MSQATGVGTRAGLPHFHLVDFINRGLAVRDSLSTEPAADPDAGLVARLAAGDQSALSELMKRHGRRLRHIAVRMTGRVEDAEDIVQEAFVAFWRRAPRLKPDGAPFAAYLTRTVVNRCIDRSRRERLRRFIGLETVREPEDPEPGADHSLAMRSEAAAVMADLQQLPARQRAAILLVSTEEQSIADVAGVMNLSVGAVEQLLVRARRTLRLRAIERTKASEGGVE